MASFKRALSLVAVVGLVGALAPSAALAQRPRGGHAAVSSRPGHALAHQRFATPQTSVFPVPADPWKSWGVPQVHHRHPGHSTPFLTTPGFIGTPSVVVTTPGAPDVIQGTTIFYAPAPAPVPVFGGTSTPPAPTLVEHPSGWYQLRGDGVTAPYSWVWVPKPPVSAPPSASAEPPARSADSSARDERGPAYHWTDGTVTTWTNRLERVPRQFRDQAASTARPD